MYHSLYARRLDKQTADQAAERNDSGEDKNHLIIKIRHQPDPDKGPIAVPSVLLILK